MSVHIRTKGKRYYLDIYHQGRRVWESTGLTMSSDPQQNKEVKRLVEILRSKREQQIVSGEWGLIDPIEGKRSLISYAEGLAGNQPVKNPLPKSLRYLRAYAGTVSIGAITEKWIDGYRAFLLEQKQLSHSTASKYLSALIYIMKKATRDRIIPRNPAEGVKNIKTPETLKVHLERSELERLAQTSIGGELGAEVRRAFLFGVFTGLRVSDIRSLIWGEIERESRQVSKRQQKTGRVVSVPLHDSAWAIINDGCIHRRDEAVFPLLAVTKANTNQYLKSWATKASVEKDIGWHTARHTFAVLSLAGGADFYTVSKLLGHTKPQTTAVYARATDGMKRRAVENLPEISIAEKDISK